MSGKSLQKRENKKGRSTDPWGTLSVTLLEQEQHWAINNGATFEVADNEK